MIKLFRQIRYQAMNEHKTGKQINPVSRYFKYAIGEIILVVLGILIALQINNWNEQRKDQIKESLFLKQVHSEFIENKLQFEIIRKFHTKSLNSCNWMLSNQPFKTVSVDSLRHHSYWVRVAYTFDPSQSTIKSLISSGSINLIQDYDLKELLIRWQDLINDYLEEEKGMQKFINDHFLPFTLDNFKLYGDEEPLNTTLNFNDVLNFNQKQLDKYLNLITVKKHLLNQILFLSRDGENKNTQTELEKVTTIMDLIIEKSKS